MDGREGRVEWKDGGWSVGGGGNWGLHTQNKEFLYPLPPPPLPSDSSCTTVWHFHGPALLLPPSIPSDPSHPLCLGLHLPQAGKLLLLPPVHTTLSEEKEEVKVQYSPGHGSSAYEQPCSRGGERGR